MSKYQADKENNEHVKEEIISTQGQVQYYTRVGASQLYDSSVCLTRTFQFLLKNNKDSEIFHFNSADPQHYKNVVLCILAISHSITPTFATQVALATESNSQYLCVCGQ